MLQELTKEQEELMYVVRDEWLNRLSPESKLDKENATKGIQWLYEFSKLNCPEILFVESPLGAQIAANLLQNVRENVSQNVWGNVWGNVWENVWQNVRENVEQNVGQNVRGNVEQNVEQNVRENVEQNVWQNVSQNVRENVGQKWEPFSWYGSIADYSWVSSYDFFSRINIVKNDEFNKFKNLLKSNVYDMIQLDTFCIVCAMPSILLRDEEQRLHSTTSPAIAWKDGYEQHYLWGIYFDKKLWGKVVNKTLSIKEVLGLENTEQRMAALKIYGPESCLEAANAKLLNRSERGNELYVLKDLFSEPQYALKYSCPSTGRVYVSFVPPEIGIDALADKAMAWKFQLNLEEYNGLRFEA